jgi:hypothetical protein
MAVVQKNSPPAARQVFRIWRCGVSSGDVYYYVNNDDEWHCTLYYQKMYAFMLALSKR